MRRLTHIADKARRGMALITVLIALMIISIILLELQHSSMIERKLAYNDLNQLQAYYLAKAGARVGLLRVALFAKALKDPNLKSMVPAGIDIKPYLDLIWNVSLPAFPPEKGTIKQLVKADKDAAEKVLDETRISDGQFSTAISSEGSKINLNFLALGDSGTPPDPRTLFTPPATSLVQHVAQVLANLLDNFMKESEDPNAEYPDLRPEELVTDIFDWVNPGSQRLNGGNKDQYYEGLTPPYKAKRTRFYTLDEVRLVKGIDEHLFEKLRPNITVYSYDGKININTASPTILKALYRDFTEDDLNRISEEKGKRGGSWLKEQDFVDYVTKTLGRNGFSQLYPNPAEYPFTVSNQSFIIESLGTVKKSKSQVQKLIRVGVALTTATSNPPPNTNQADCVRNSAWFWDSRFSPAVCRTKPTNAKMCGDLAGGWDDPTKCCRVSNLPPLCPVTAPPAGTPAAATPGTPGAPGATPTPAAQPVPNTLRIIFWSET